MVPHPWFCCTHLLKAMRNQLLASQQGGSKGFIDEYNTPFGWNFLLKLNEHVKVNNTTQNKIDIRLSDKVANPDGFRKMDVSTAKIFAETKTITRKNICAAFSIFQKMKWK